MYLQLRVIKQTDVERVAEIIRIILDSIFLLDMCT